MFRLKSVSVSLGNRCTNCVAHPAGSLRSQSASSTAAAENPSLWKLLSKCQGTRWLSGGGKLDKELYSDFGLCNLQFIYRTLVLLLFQGLSEQPTSLPYILRWPGGSAVCEWAGLWWRAALLEWNRHGKKVCFKDGRQVQQVSQEVTEPPPASRKTLLEGWSAFCNKISPHHFLPCVVCGNIYICLFRVFL